MPTFEIVGLIGLACIAWLWLDSIKVRELGIRAVESACSAEGLQLLDGTVSIASLRPVRDGDGRVQLRRVYSFEYSDTGDNRRNGSVVMLGREVLIINIGLRLASPLHTLH